MGKWRTGILSLLIAGWLLPAWAAPATPVRELAQTRALLAIEYMKLGNMRVAMENADLAIAVDPAFQAGHLAKALIYMQLGVSRDAETAFRKALSLDAANPEVNNNYGLFLCGLNRFDEGVKAFDRALADPFYDSPQSAMANKALCLERMGKRDEALQLLLAALRKAPADPVILRELTRLGIAQQNLTMAEFYYQRLARDERALGAPELALGIRLARLKQDEATASRLTGLLKGRFPDSPEFQQIMMGN